jgi:hypothetical protein
MKRWNKVIQPQLPKDTGTPRINRIRRITLIEADLNLSLSLLFGRRMMDNAESYNLLHPHQYGSRQGRMSISAVLLKRLSYDITRQTRMMRSCSIMMPQHAMTESFLPRQQCLADVLVSHAMLPLPSYRYSYSWNTFFALHMVLLAMASLMPPIGSLV